MGDFHARGEAAGYAGDPEDPEKWDVLGSKEEERCTGNEKQTMNPTPELLMDFSFRCELILRTRPGEGPWHLELCQLESDQITFLRGSVEAIPYLEVQSPRPWIS